MELLVTGGTGLVGHALQKIKPDAIYVGSKNFDLTKKEEVEAMFQTYKPKKIIHLAAKVGGIIDNMNHPAEFIYQNVLINSYVIHYANKYQVKKLIGVLSNCAYPDISKKYPLSEEQLHNGSPQSTNFSYAYAKRVLEVQISSYKKQYGCNFSSVIPCSIYGPYDNFDKKSSHFLSALIKKILEAKKKNEKTITLLGTGKPLRQYIYSEDLARILLSLLDIYKGTEPINIAPDENLSIKQIAEIALKVTDSSDIQIQFDDSFPDGQYRKDLRNNKLLNIIGNFHFTPLADGVKQTYEWLKQTEEKK
jgi:GDP-L-fucose synthase